MAIKPQTSNLEKIKIFSPLTRLVEIELLFPDEAELDEKVESDDLGLVLKKYLISFAYLTLDMLQ